MKKWIYKGVLIEHVGRNMYYHYNKAGKLICSNRLDTAKTYIDKEMTSTAEQQKIADWLQEILGRNYVVRYDDCESGMTRVYFKPLNIMTAEVPNSEMHAGISTSPYLVSQEDLMKAIVLNLI